MNNKLRQCTMAIVRNPAWLCFIWLGASAVISLLATPVKFTAASITRPVALDVGRVTFEAMNKAEFVALILLLIVVRVSNEAREYWIPVFGVVLILLAQSIWLLPELGGRVDMILAGNEPAPSSAHTIYGVLEVAKLTLLTVIGVTGMLNIKEQN